MRQTASHYSPFVVQKQSEYKQTLLRSLDINPLFTGTSTQKRFAFYVALCVCIITMDYYFEPMKKVRSWLSVAVTPIQWVVDLPEQTWTWLNGRLIERDKLLSENQIMRRQTLLAQRQIQKLSALTTENARLRELLLSAKKLDEKVRLTELIGINSDPFVHEIIINDGSRSGVFVGQSVLDQTGVMGQVSAANPFNSRVILITDANHAIPVQNNRNGLRSVAYGVGSYEFLELTDITDTDDIQVGDLLVSSGLGLRFPEGYPVAQVVSIEKSKGQSFSIVKAKPTAKLSFSRQLLLVSTPHQQNQLMLQQEN